MNKKLLVIGFIIASMPIYAVQVAQKTVHEFVQAFPQSTYIQCTKDYNFNHVPFPLYKESADTYFPSQGTHADLFIMKVPNGTAYVDKSGYVFLNNCFLEELQIKDLHPFQGQSFADKNISPLMGKAQGRVAIVSHLYPYCYGHWIFDVLSQLAVLELHNIEYDYLCIPYYTNFMKESLEIWGIDSSKIIPLTVGMHIQADEIVMSTATSRDRRYIPKANYYIDFLLHYVRDKMLKGISSEELLEGSDKIFISRKDASAKRVVPNEDAVFALFEPLGFKRYELAKLSMKQQLALFYNAKKIVSFSGSGGTNVLFCQEGAHYIDIVQSMVDATFFYVADSCGINYSILNDSTYEDLVQGGPWSKARALSLDSVMNFLMKSSEL